MVDRRCLRKRAMTNRIGLDFSNIGFAITQSPKRFGHSAVDDFPITATGEFLELHQRKIWLDTGRITIHHQTDGAGGCNHGGLRIPVTMTLTQSQRLVPRRFGMGDKRHVRAGCMIERHRMNREIFITHGLTPRSAAMIPDHPQHMIFIGFILREGAQFTSHFGRGCIRHTCHDGGQSPTHRPTGV